MFNFTQKKFDELRQMVFGPKKPIGHWLDVVMVLVSAGVSIWSFAIINFKLCSSENCHTLPLSGIWVFASPLFIFYAIGCLVVADFLRKNRGLPAVYSHAISGVSVFPILFFGFLPFMVSVELTQMN